MNFRSIFPINFVNNFLNSKQDNSNLSNSNIGTETNLSNFNDAKISETTNWQKESKYELKNTILGKIKTHKMTSSHYFKIYNLFLFLAIFVLSIFSIFLLAGFLADLNEINAISDDFWANFWQNSFLEFVILASLIGILIYLIYRQTDWILVRFGRTLLIGILIFITIFGIITSLFVKKHLETVQSLENFSYRRGRIAHLGQKMKEKKAFLGKIIEINKTQNSLKIANKTETKIFYWQNENLNQNNPQNLDNLPNLPNNIPKNSRNYENLKDKTVQNIEQKIENSEKFEKSNNLGENPKEERKTHKNQQKKNQNLTQIIEKLEIGERILLYFENDKTDKMENKMMIVGIKTF